MKDAESQFTDITNIRIATGKDFAENAGGQYSNAVSVGRKDMHLGFAISITTKRIGSDGLCLVQNAVSWLARAVAIIGRLFVGSANSQKENAESVEESTWDLDFATTTFINSIAELSKNNQHTRPENGGSNRISE